MFTKGKATCEFCKRQHKDNCNLDFEDDDTMIDVLNKIRDGRDLNINIHWRDKNQKANLKYFD
jgi:hypothetical protein